MCLKHVLFPMSYAHGVSCCAHGVSCCEWYDVYSLPTINLLMLAEVQDGVMVHSTRMELCI